MDHCIEMRRKKHGDSNPLPVAFVTTSMGIGGAERLLVELVTRLNRALFAPMVVCLKDRAVLGDQLAQRGIQVFDRVSRAKFDVSIVNRLADLFKRERVGVVCTVGTGGDRSFWGRLAARWAGVPAIISCPHSMGVPDRFEASNRMLSGITDAFVAVAQRQKDYLVRHEGFSASKVHVIHNGIDLGHFSPREMDLSVRLAHGIPLTAPVAGLVACLRQEKSVETLLEAAVFVRRRLPESHFVIVGDGPERKRLEATAASFGLGDCVHFVGLCSDVRPWLHAMNLLTLVSVCEAFPVSLLEAMGCGKPVVATRVGAIPEMVVHGKTGLLVAPRDPQDVAGALCQLFSDPGAAHLMGQAARAHVENHFDLNGMVRGYERLFGSLYGHKHRRRILATRD